MKALWLPYEVTDLEAAERFYVKHIGLSTVDGWDRDGERGRVLAVGSGAFVELVGSGTDRPGPVAFELADAGEVDARYRGIAAHQITRAPSRYPRGHYGCEFSGPGGAALMVWSER